MISFAETPNEDERAETMSCIDILKKYEKTAGSRALELRLSLSLLVIERLKILGMKDEEFCAKMKISKKRFALLLNSDYNWDSEFLGRVLKALDIRARINEN